MTFVRFAVAVLFFVLSADHAHALVTSTNIWINEFHYDDNVPNDAGEFIEVVAPASFTDLSNIAIDFYNGNGGAVYDTHTLDTFTPGDTTSGFTVYTLPDSAFVQIQNGGPDGLALSVNGNTVQFLSYEGSFTATNGPANGILSTDVGVSESNSTSSTASIGLQGNGGNLADFGNNWVAAATNSAGSANDLQSFATVTAGKLFNEEFDDTSQFSSGAAFFHSDEAISGGDDYFGISDGAGGGDFGGDTPPINVKNYIGANGNFLTGQDLDGDGTNPSVIEWTGIDISGATNLQFSGAFAEFFDNPGDIDQANDSILVEVQIDGGGFQSVLAFEGADFSNTTFNGIFREDTDFDGEGDGVTLNNEFSTFIRDIGATGNLLDLRLTVNLNAGDEDFGADSFMILGERAGGNNGDAVPEPTTLALLGFGGLILTRRRRAAA